MADVNMAAEIAKSLAEQASQHASNDSDHVTMLWSALIGCTTLLAAIVGVVYKRINDDIKDEETARELCHKEIQAKLDRGISSFTELGKDIVKIGEQIKALEAKDNYQGGELDRLDDDITALTDKLTKIVFEHDDCLKKREKLGL